MRVRGTNDSCFCEPLSAITYVVNATPPYKSINNRVRPFNDNFKRSRMHNASSRVDNQRAEQSCQSLTGGLPADLLQQGLAVVRGADVERHVGQPLGIQLGVGDVDDQVADGLRALSLGAIDPVGEPQDDAVGEMLQVPGVVSNRSSAAASLIAVTVATGESALAAAQTIVSDERTDRKMFHDS